jgi:hypothetical protein
MRSPDLSTNLQRPNLARILSNGREAFGNRRKNLFSIAFLLIFCPQLLVLLAWGQAASSVKQRLVDTATLSPLDQALTIFSDIGGNIAWPTLLGFLCVATGVLALAQTSVDYFESRPEKLSQTLLRALRVLITKGFGVLLLLLILLPALTIMPLLRAVALSMLVMLPVTLVASLTGGFKTTWDTLFLRYATHTKYGRWPIFINVLSVSGVFLTALFGVSILIESLGMLDIWLDIPAGILERDLTVLGMQWNVGQGLSQVLTLVWESLAVAMIMPFTAALYQMSTIPQEHTPFETEA